MEGLPPGRAVARAGERSRSTAPNKCGSDQEGHWAVDKLFALLLMQAWLAVMVYGWWRNRRGQYDAESFERHARWPWTRWMLGGNSREQHMRQQRLISRISLPFALCFYLLAMYGILSAH